MLDIFLTVLDDVFTNLVVVVIKVEPEFAFNASVLVKFIILAVGNIRRSSTRLLVVGNEEFWVTKFTF